MAETPRANVSYPFDGQPPDNLPIVDQPVSLFSPWVTFDGMQIVLNELTESVDFEPLGGDSLLSLFQSE